MPTTPIFSFGQHDASSSLYRPVVSSPLSSSPIRASSASPPPLSSSSSQTTMSSPFTARDPNTCCLRDIQTSPVSGSEQPLFGEKSSSSSSSGVKFKYANRNVRPNPVVQKREDKQEGRRRLFLQNVRQRADDKKWDRRGGENELLKLEWSRLTHELRKAKDSDLEGFVMEEEIEDEPEILQDHVENDFDMDAMLVDAIERQEEAEIEAIISELPTTPTSNQTQQQPEEAQHHFYSEDDDYDSIFMDFLSSEREQSGQSMTLSQDVEML
ncbi:hypothetical protein B0H66DRAFT_600547 [Apodospora peruviana]|uniref:Uncharacterized protein n=1 Tax=Apodospora peruviana TaxID=516989 RepID=A0AAE0IK84_9PEZI|nr:hypothetical protein B0H66DRAFT_600547 [Apodospora peruviana]